MIETTINELSKSEYPKYPYLGVYTTDAGYTRIVLFTSVNTGTQLYGEGPLKGATGHHSKDWGESKFFVFDGELTLKNK